MTITTNPRQDGVGGQCRVQPFHAWSLSISETGQPSLPLNFTIKFLKKIKPFVTLDIDLMTNIKHGIERIFSRLVSPLIWNLIRSGDSCKIVTTAYVKNVSSYFTTSGSS